jgi:trimeric autotransporter adhesin
MSNIKQCLLIGLFWVIGMPMAIGQMTAAEYFFDADPGIGLGTSLSVTATDSVSWTNLNIPTSGLTSGFHNLFVRVRYTTGGLDRWSTAENRPFYLSNTSGATPLITTISQAEYFFDSDPGITLGTPLSIAAAADSLTWTSQAINSASLAVGFHNLYVRVKDGEGRWSTAENRPFYLSSGAGATPLITTISQAEYFFDSDPGITSGTSLSIAAAADSLTWTSQAISTASLAVGFHNLYVRVKDGDGRWSTVENRPFYLNAPVLNQFKIQKLEYFVDTDPGAGNGLFLTISPTVDTVALINQILPLSNTCLTLGNHILFTRFLNEENNWSTAEEATFTVINTDAAVTAVAVVSTACTLTANETVTITVQNNGTQALNAGQISISLGVTGSNAATYTATNPAPIAVGATGIVTINSVNLSIAAMNTLAATLTLCNDNVATNNVLSINRLGNTTPTVTLSSPASIVYGSTPPITLTATLSPAPNNGTIQFFVDGIAVGSPATVMSGVATLSYTPSVLTAANHVISANYSGSTNYMTVLGFCPANSTSPTNGTLTITQRPLNFTGARLYNGLNTFTAAQLAASNIVNSDAVTVSGSATVSSKNIGTYTSFTTNSLVSSNSNYMVNGGTVSVTITPITLTPSIIASNKIYNGNTIAILSNQTVATVLVGETVNLVVGAANFSNKDIGTAKTVTATGLSLSGSDAGNYVLSVATITTTANITPITLTPTIVANNKQYDGNATATLSSQTVATVLSGENVTLVVGAANFSNKNIGIGKTVTATGLTLSGLDAGNYVLSVTTITTTANITPITLTPTIAANNKQYDGSATATLSAQTIATVLVGENVNLVVGAANFSNKNIGTAKTVTATGLSLNGADAGNYVLSVTTITTTANITPITLAPTIVANNKIYDGNATATLSSQNVATVLGTENVNLVVGAANFSNKDIGTAKTVTATGLALSGADAGNYVLSVTTITTMANITPITLTPTIAANNKQYDGSATATLSSQTVATALSGETVNLVVGAANFSSKNIGTGKTVTATGLALSGADAGNYVLSVTTITTMANITPITLTPTIAANNKQYDGSATATLSAQTVATVLVGETVNLVVGAANFSSKNIGTGKTVTATGLALSGADAGNYVLSVTTITTMANITPITLTPTIAANNKQYDGNATATLSSQTVATILSGETVNLVVGAASFSSKDIGTGKTVTATGLALSGADAGNYVLSVTTITTMANITVRILTPTVVANNKIYDGNTTATLSSQTLATVVSGEDVSLLVTAANFDNPNAGTGKTVTATGLSLTGSDIGNYALSATSATALANITPKSATVTANNQSKCWKTAFAFVGTEFTTSGFLAGDVVGSVTLTSTATAAATVAGTYTITPSAAVGTGLGNYNITYTEGSFTVIDCSPKVAIKVYLQGAYDVPSGLMTHGLRTLILIPTASPYSSAPYTAITAFTHVNGGGGESATATAFNATDANAIVDWVFVELRSSSNSATVVATQAALLQRDGDVVATDGVSELKFTTVPVGNYFIAVRHRNHVAVRSAGTKNLTYLSTTSMDFTTSLSETLATPSGTAYNALATMSNGKFALWGGNVNSDASTRRTGSATTSDYSLFLNYLGAASVISAVYRREDFNMDGNVRRSGSATSSDYSKFLSYLGANSIISQPPF